MNIKLISHTENPEKVVAAAAKLCYSKSEIGTLMDNLTDEKVCEFLDRLSNLGHCYDGETEVLTKKGFVKWPNVNEDTEFATVDPKSRNFTGFEKATQLFNYDYNGEMVKISHHDVDLLVTNGHKIYASVSRGSKLRVCPEYSLIPTNYTLDTGKKVWESPFRLVLSAKNSNYESSNADSIYKLYGFFIGDGYAAENLDKSSICFHLKKERKIAYLRNVCNELGIELKCNANNKYAIKTDNIYSGKFRKMFYNENGDKTFPISFLTMTSSQFNCFIDGLLNSDGHYCGLCKNIEYSTCSMELIDRLQALCSINNSNCSYTTAYKGNGTHSSCYRVYFYKEKSLFPMINDSRTRDRANAKIVSYSGKVYCASVSTGLLIVRRNGKVCLCGNCSPTEHASFTFGIEGVSRSFLAQISRHRLASLSVQSQRYVDMTNAGFVMPEEFADDEPASKTFEDAVGYALKSYEGLRKYLTVRYIRSGMDTKSAEKKAQEDARYVLPEACCTKMIITMNARELNHFFNLRCCNRAQWEIRECAEKMLALVYPIAPHLFKNAGPSCVCGACPEGSMSCGKAKEMREKYSKIKV